MKIDTVAIQPTLGSVDHRREVAGTLNDTVGGYQLAKDYDWCMAIQSSFNEKEQYKSADEAVGD